MDYENLTPQYRIEEYLEAIVEGWVDATMVAYPEVPSWRIEEFLDAFITYIWEDEDHPRNPCPNPVWRLEECLRAIYDVMTGAATPWPFPTPTNRIEEYLAAIHAYLADGTELPVPEPVWRIEQWLAYALDAVKQGGGVTKTVSGTMVHITDALAKAALSVLASIEPIQDLHGYSSPWPAGGGVNKINYLSCIGVGARDGTESIYSNNTSISGDSLTISQSFSANGGILKGVGTFPLATGEYVTISGKAILNGTTEFVVGIANYNGGGTSNINQNVVVANGRFSVTLYAKSDYAKTAIFLQPKTTGSTAVVSEVMVALGQTEQPYSPYSNICPISGRTGVEVYKTGVNVWDEQYYVSSNRIQSNYIPVLPNTTYNRVSPNNIIPFYYDADKNQLSTGTWGTGVFTTPADCYYLRFQVDPVYGVTYNHDISINYPSTDTDYHAYQGQTISVDWTSEAGTVYGGTLDVVTGVLTVDRAICTATDFTSVQSGVSAGGLHWADFNTPNITTNGTSLCSILSVRADGNAGWASTVPCYALTEGTRVRVYCKEGTLADFQSKYAGLQICYPLATPLTYQLTPQEVQMLLSENYVWSSSGDTVSVTYYAEGNANTLQSLNILLGGNYSNPKTADDVSDKEALEIILGGNK